MLPIIADSGQDYIGEHRTCVVLHMKVAHGHIALSTGLDAA
jgi:hypothetical protein